MGATAIDSPIGVEMFLLLFLLHFLRTMVTGCVFLVCVCFFGAFSGALVCVECVVFCLSNILIIREFIFYIHLDCDSKIVSPTLVQNLHILCGSH